MILLEGAQVARGIYSKLAQAVETLKNERKRPPHLSIVLIGSDPASLTYVETKRKVCQKVGFTTTLHRYEDLQEHALLRLIDAINRDPTVDGLIVQLPLPGHIDTHRVVYSIDSAKDVDGFHPNNLGALSSGAPKYIPATPWGILELFKFYHIDLAGKHCVIVGRSRTVGRPLSILMSTDRHPGNATVTLCHRYTQSLPEITRQADVLVAAAGEHKLILRDMVKPGAVVVDVGITRVDDPACKRGYRICGDVDFNSVAPVCSFITPVPGGVGPMTVAGLLMNTWKAAQSRPNTYLE